MLTASLKAVGAARSIVIDEDDVILAGNGVTEAAKAAGITTVRVIETTGDELIAVRRTGLSDDQKRALALYDNRTAELAAWNLDQLHADFANGVDLSAFWNPDELMLMFGTQATPSWDGMPEFTQENHLAWRTLLVHFAGPEDFIRFCQALGREDLTEKTKFIWYPQQAREAAVGAHAYRSDDEQE